jgi:hypothetical protein
LKWVEVGLDAKSVQEHAAAMDGGEDAFEVAMNRWSDLADQAANIER